MKFEINHLLKRLAMTTVCTQHFSGICKKEEKMLPNDPWDPLNICYILWFCV